MKNKFYFMKNVPSGGIDLSDWTYVIKNPLLKSKFSIVALSLMGFILLTSIALGFWDFWKLYPLLWIAVLTGVLHEAIHWATVFFKGDVSWGLNGRLPGIRTNAVMNKWHYLTFTLLPFVVLTIVPSIISFFPGEFGSSMLRFIAWVNFAVSGADIMRAVFIIPAPSNARFCRGCYKVY